MNKLKIYACSGVGDTTQDTPVRYWENDTNSLTNTQAVNSLLARINEINIELLKLKLSADERISRYNEIDLLVVCMQVASAYQNDATTLARAGRIIASLVDAGDFDYASSDDAERDEHLTGIEDKIFKEIKSGIDADASSEFYKWYQINVIALNQYGLTAAEQSAISKSLQSAGGVGATDASLPELLQDGGTYFMYYCFIPESAYSKLPAAVVRKIGAQEKIYKYIMDVYVPLYGSEEAVLRVIRASMLNHFGEQPEDVINGLLQRNGIGSMTVMEIIALVGMIFSTVLSLLPIIISAVQAKKAAQYQAEAIAKYSVPTQKEVEEACPRDLDWKKAIGGGSASPAGNNKLLWIGGAILLLLLLKK